MNCEKLQSRISDLSADNLPAREANEMLAHFATCSSCHECWEEYQQMMFALSTSTQPIPGDSRSQQMWNYCQQRITETELDARYSTPARAALRNSIKEDSGTSVWNWIGVQPRWGWVALGGAMAAIAGTWFVTSPAPDPGNTHSITTAQLFAPSKINTVNYPPGPAVSNTPLDLPSFDASSPTVFEAPSAPSPATSQFVDHRSFVPEAPAKDAASSSVVSYPGPTNSN